MTKAEKIITIFSLLLLVLTLTRLLTDDSDVPFVVHPLPSASVSEAQKLNINTASTDELDSLPGIGPVLAARILEYINSVGPIDGPEELMEIDGIGESTVAGMEDYICYGEETP